MSGKSFITGRLAATLGACWLLFAGQAAAATFVVNAFNDATDASPGNGICETGAGNQVCTLRAAIQEANSLPGPDVIALPAGIYRLTLAGADEDAAATGDLDITDDLSILGAGADQVTIDGNRIDRVFHILPGHTVGIDGVTISNGAASIYGGGVLNELSVLTVSNCVLSGNFANPTNVNFGQGGGIFNNGTLTVIASTISGNSGDGIHNIQFGSATVVNSTITGNPRAGIFNNGIARLVLSNSTLADNSNFNGSIWNSSLNGTVTFKNTIVFESVAPPCGGFTGGFVSNGYNLENGNTCNFTGVGDLVFAPPMLGPLQNNGGSIPTRALETGSAAIDAGNPAAPGSEPGACEATDQRGVVRPADGDGNGTAICDIGAFEHADAAPPDTTPPVLSLPSNITVNATSPSGAVVNYTASATDAVDGPVAVTCDLPSGSTFPIGTTTVNCSASDSRANTANGSFTVTVNGSAAQIADLLDLFYGLNLPNRIESSLASKLNQALVFAAAGKTTGACGKLGDFIAEVTAKTGKGGIAPADAAQLIASATQIKAALGCP